MNLHEFLGRHNISFELLEHRDTYDAQHMAEAIHVSGHHVAKTVLLRAERDIKQRYVVAVLPATHKIDLFKAAEILSASDVNIATEEEITRRCPDCEVGALPPFGSHYNMQTILDESLIADQEIVFEGTNHHESIRMKLDDYETLEHPLVGSFSHLALQNS